MARPIYDLFLDLWYNEKDLHKNVYTHCKNKSNPEGPFRILPPIMPFGMFHRMLIVYVQSQILWHSLCCTVAYSDVQIWIYIYINIYIYIYIYILIYIYIYIIYIYRYIYSCSGNNLYINRFLYKKTILFL